MCFTFVKALVRVTFFLIFKKAIEANAIKAAVKYLELAIKSLSVVLSVKSTLHASLKIEIGYQKNENRGLMDFATKLLSEWKFPSNFKILNYFYTVEYIQISQV